MKRIVFVLALIMPLLVLGSVVMATEVTKYSTAKVHVNEYISVTLTPCATPPALLDFGSGDPGDTDKPITCQGSTTEAIGISVDEVTNTPVDVYLKGDDFTYTTYTIPVSGITYDDDYRQYVGTPANETQEDTETNNAPGTLSTSYGTVVADAYWANVKTGQLT